MKENLVFSSLLVQSWYIDPIIGQFTVVQILTPKSVFKLWNFKSEYRQLLFYHGTFVINWVIGIPVGQYCSNLWTEWTSVISGLSRQGSLAEFWILDFLQRSWYLDLNRELLLSHQKCWFVDWCQRNKCFKSTEKKHYFEFHNFDKGLGI